MRLFRQLGSCGTALLFGPLLWLGLCIGARALGQHAYEVNITAWTRNHRINDGPEFDAPRASARPVRDPHALTEIGKYAKVWTLEPGACAEFPDAARLPFSWNPFHASALMMRLKQKQAFLMTQHHLVRRRGNQLFLAPDPEAALGGRRFLLTLQGDTLLEAIEL